MFKHLSLFKIFIWMIGASLSVSNVLAQQINVEKFIFLENDLDARVNHPKKDQNGEVCALIKVVTKHTGFSFDIGSLGVVASEQKTGEIWVYIPRGAQKITIKHAQLGVLRNYIFPMPIESANVYEMLLTSADIEIVVKEKVIETQWMVITTEPSGANVFINDDYLGKTPYQGQLPAGDYNYRIENPQYHTQAGKIKITDKKETLNFNLKPNFGNLYISSLPAAGMQIYLNNQNTGKTTPATLPKINSGKHTVKLLNEWYEPIEKEFEVKDEQTTNAQFTMQAVFANIKIKTNTNASIEINGVKRGEGEFNDRLRKGIYTVKLKHEQYYDQEFQLIVEANKNQELSYELKPKNGTLEIVTTPFDATILLNNKNYGTSPNTIKDLLIGTYNLKVHKIGYKEVVKTIEIKENEITKIDLKLELDDSSIKQITEKVVSTNNSASGIQYGRGITDINGNTYKTVIIGNQEWMAENLRNTKYADGTAIPNVTDKTKWYNLTTGAWCNYENNSQYEATYGKLYNWYAVNTSKLCPTGWHVPTDEEWTVLTDYLSNKGHKSKEGIALKASSTWANNGNGTDNFGWKGLPGGCLNGYYGYFGGVESSGYWWSSSERTTGYACYRRLYRDGDDVNRGNFYKSCGYSVRCLRD
jgi:uncharacterized protein (TIGR02145 family)